MVTSTAADAISYFGKGYHAFIASDEASDLDKVVASIQDELRDEPLCVIDGRNPTNLSAYANDVVRACEQLLSTIGAPCPERPDMLSTWLSHLQHCFHAEDRQGYLLVNHIDDVIRAQETFQIEGPFREVMQFNDDVAIAWLGSRNIILEIHQYERPFYLSHRVFWL